MINDNADKHSAGCVLHFTNMIKISKKNCIFVLVHVPHTPFLWNTEIQENKKNLE